MIRPPRHLLLGLLPFAATSIAGSDSTAADERFGVMTHFAHGWDPSLIGSIARAGVAGVRDELYWREVEPQKGIIHFSDHYERTMAMLAENKLSPLIVLSFENEAYDGGATPHTDEGIAGYARYGGEILRHYGQIKAVEVWNEFNGGFVRGPAENDRAATYLRLLRATYAELKRVRPDVIVVGGATAGVPLPYWEKLFASGALQFMDVLSVHPYRYEDPPEGIETDMAELFALVARYNGGRPKPIWVTEIGWNVRPSQGPGDSAIDDFVQAQYLVRAHALLFLSHVQRVYWYLFRDYHDLHMGLVRDDSALTEKPAFAAMRTMATQLRNACFIARDSTPREIYSLSFRRASSEEVRVMWSLQPRSIRVSGVTSIVDLLGRPIETTDNLQLDESPIFVSGALRGLPPTVSAVVTEARTAFSANQGGDGWSYGFASEDTGSFTVFPAQGADDWRRAWWGDQPYLSVSATDQHPSVRDGRPVTAIRRWQSDRHDTVRVTGNFRGGMHGGDGVGVAVAVNGQQRFRKLLGGGKENPVAENFDFIEAVEPGTTIDFAVDPGPAANIDYDGTAVSVTISTTPK